MYNPAWDVCTWLKVSVLVVEAWFSNWSPIVVSTVLPGNSHTKVGLFTRCSSNRAVQVMVSWPPASTDIPWIGKTETIEVWRAAE